MLIGPFDSQKTITDAVCLVKYQIAVIINSNLIKVY